MDDETKARAVEKANAVSQMIGYPDFVINPAKLDEHYANVRNNATLVRRIHLKLHKHECCWVYYLNYIFNMWNLNMYSFLA